ncbi:MAG: hypothetical protein RSF00_10195, partial [Oscillospiraceae bacterium]
MDFRIIYFVVILKKAKRKKCSFTTVTLLVLLMMVFLQNLDVAAIAMIGIYLSCFAALACYFAIKSSQYTSY